MRPLVPVEKRSFSPRTSNEKTISSRDRQTVSTFPSGWISRITLCAVESADECRTVGLVTAGASLAVSVTSTVCPTNSADPTVMLIVGSGEPELDVGVDVAGVDMNDARPLNTAA